MHETLVLCCAEALKSAGTGFGNLFSQVDYLAKRCGMQTAERMAVQQMRRHSNHATVLSHEEWLHDVRALAQFISAVFKAGIPGELLQRLPLLPSSTTQHPSPNTRYLRCVVSRFDGQTIWADTADGGHVEVDYSEHEYLRKMMREGMQLNLLDSHAEGERVQPGLVVVEPDFLLDISALAHCFQGSYGHHPLFYTAERLRPRGNSQAMLLGNFAGAALDDIIHNSEAPLTDTMNSFFREQALQFTTCDDFNPQRFVDDARQQSANIREAVEALFGQDYDRRKALLEPSFVCERLGLQGRVDLMTSDMRLLVEQKSGKNYNLERNAQPTGTGLQKEEHYVQLLLYYGILRYNFGRTDSQVDIRLLYSRYPAARGLLYVNFYRELFREAIRLRNRIVATEMLIAREGFGRILPLLRADVVFKGAERDGYFHRYIEPSLSTLNTQLSSLNQTERAYYERMMTFVYREQLLAKVGRQEGQGGAVSDLWNMPLAEKQETGNIILGNEANPTLNFRRGDMVYLYNYDGDEPDVRKAILYKGTIEQMGSDGVKVRLADEQQGIDPMKQGRWAIEHAGSDMNTTSAIKSLHQFITSAPRKRALLLGQREPEADTSLRLSRQYHPHYDDVLLRAKQARDYFLLVGPPGTGKTSMALRFMVEEAEGDLLLMREQARRETQARRHTPAHRGHAHRRRHHVDAAGAALDFPAEALRAVHRRRGLADSGAGTRRTAQQRQHRPLHTRRRPQAAARRRAAVGAGVKGRRPAAQRHRHQRLPPVALRAPAELGAPLRAHTVYRHSAQAGPYAPRHCPVPQRVVLPQRAAGAGTLGAPARHVVALRPALGRRPRRPAEAAPRPLL